MHCSTASLFVVKSITSWMPDVVGINVKPGCPSGPPFRALKENQHSKRKPSTAAGKRSTFFISSSEAEFGKDRGAILVKMVSSSTRSSYPFLRLGVLESVSAKLSVKKRPASKKGQTVAPNDPRRIGSSSGRTRDGKDRCGKTVT